MTLRRLVLALSLALALPAPAFAADAAAKGAPDAAATPATAVSAADAAVAQPLLEAFNSRDAQRLNARIDAEALIDRVMEGSSQSERTRREFRRGAMSASASLGRNLANAMVQGNVQVRLLRVTPRAAGDGHDVLLRYDMHDAQGAFAGVDYIEAELGPDGRMRDWYSYGQGDRASDLMRRLMGLMAAGEGGNVIARALGLEQVDEALVAAMRQMNDRRAQGDLAGALAALDGMQGPVRETRMWAVLRVLHTPPEDEARHAANLADLHRGFGDDPDMQLLLLDHYFYTGEFAEMIAAIEGFERAVVEDEITNRFKCVGAVTGELWAEAERTCSRAIELAPEVEDVWWLRLGALSGARDVAGVIAAIEAYERQFGSSVDTGRLVGLDGFGWLADERAFRRWASARGKGR